MEISLVKAEIEDADTIHKMQLLSFMPLLEKYQDYETSPANEAIDKTIARIEHSLTDYYIIKSDIIPVGGIRIIKMDSSRCRVGPVFILPEYQGKGIAQKAFQLVAQIYADAEVWELDTILQEQGNCYLYQKLGYRPTGKTEIINSKLTLVSYEKHVNREGCDATGLSERAKNLVVQG